MPEWLKNIIGEELYNQVKPKIDESGIKIANLNEGKYIPIDKFNSKNEKVKLLEDKVSEYEKKDKDVNKLIKDNETLKNDFEKLNSDFSAKLDHKDKEISDITKKSLLNKILSENKVVYPDLILNNLNLDEIEIDGDNLKNFNIDGVKEKYPNMFETVETSGNVNPQNSGLNTNNQDKISRLKQDYAKAAEEKNVMRMQTIRNEIQTEKLKLK